MEPEAMRSEKGTRLVVTLIDVLLADCAAAPLPDSQVTLFGIHMWSVGSSSCVSLYWHCYCRGMARVRQGRRARLLVLEFDARHLLATLVFPMKFDSLFWSLLECLIGKREAAITENLTQHLSCALLVFTLSFVGCTWAQKYIGLQLIHHHTGP